MRAEAEWEAWYNSREQWIEWYHSRGQYADKQDWLDARPDPALGSIEDRIAQMARLVALSSFTNDPIGGIDRTPNPLWKNRRA